MERPSQWGYQSHSTLNERGKQIEQLILPRRGEVAPKATEGEEARGWVVADLPLPQLR